MRILIDLTEASGVRIDFDANVVDVDLAKPCVVLASGERIFTDMVVGADGYQSIVRERMVGEREEPRIGPYTGYV